MDAKQVVQAFCELMVERDAEALRPYLADGVVYQNTGCPSSSGVDEVLQNVAGQFAMFPDTYACKTINVVADGDVVMNERLDMIKASDGTVHALPVMGTFIVRDGKIIRDGLLG